MNGSGLVLTVHVHGATNTRTHVPGPQSVALLCAQAASLFLTLASL